MEKYTLADIEKMDRVCITAAIAASVIQADPNWIRYTARTDKSLLGFPVIVLGSHVNIPRIPFIKFLRGELYMPNVKEDVTQ